MNSNSWLILALLVVAMFSYLSPNWIRELQSKLVDLISPKGETLVARLEAATLREKEKATELQKVLDAKRGLAIARASNIKLRKEIAGISEASVIIEPSTNPALSKSKTRQKTL